MIKMDELVSAIQSAVVGANSQLQGQSKDFLDRFFIPVEGSDANDSLEDASSSQSVLRPRYVTMEYPSETSNGIKTLFVDVPLISMVPVVHSRIKEVTFRSSLEVSNSEDGSLNISFPTSQTKKSSLFSKDNPTGHVAEVEIKITGDETPDGLQRLIEGYNRVLRAQIPG